MHGILIPAVADAQPVPVAAPQPELQPVEPQPSKAPEVEFNGVAGMKSIFFTDTDIAAIHNARKFYEQHLSGTANGGIAEDDFLKNLEKINASKSDAAPKTFTYPQFFLSSLAYRSPNDWVVWINDEKFVPDSGVSLAGLRILSINNEKVTVEWQPENMDKVIDDGNIDDNLIKVDIMGNKVVFTLKANQTFTSYAMKVVEGKVMPVTINLNGADATKMLVK
jgi:hypothetical protein